MLTNLFRKKTPSEVLFGHSPSPTTLQYIQEEAAPKEVVQEESSQQSLFDLLRLLTEESSQQQLLTGQATFVDHIAPDTEVEFIKAFQSAESNIDVANVVENFIKGNKLSEKDISDLINQNPAAKEKIFTILKTKQQEDTTFKKEILLLLNALLILDAELEHQLMLQYLYAGYSIDTESKDSTIKLHLLEWQHQFIGIAREEMGHLITIQNVRKSLNWGIYFDIKNLSATNNLFPYTADLEPLSKQSLAKYIYAESPPGWFNSEDEYAKKIKNILDGLVNKNTEHNAQNLDQYTKNYGVPISVLFKVILLILKELTDEQDFLTQSVTQQAHPDQWNRGYTSEERTININGKTSKVIASNVLVERIMTRWECIQAIEAIAEQGENADESTIDTDKFTHFNRFLDIFKAWESASKSDFNPSKNMATNPRVNPTEGKEITIIKDPITVLWARLLNVRYNLLLTFIEHSFNIENNFSNPSASLRGLIINGSFGEMYNLKAISNVLSTLKVSQDNNLLAGPPFEIDSVLTANYTQQLTTLLAPNYKKKDYTSLYLKFIKDTTSIAQQLLNDNKASTQAPFLINIQNNDQELLKIVSQKK